MKQFLITLAIILCSGRIAYSEGGVAGVTLGTPGLVNLNFGYYGETFGIQGSMSALYLLLGMLADDSDDTINTSEESGVFIALFQLNLDAMLIQNDNLMVAASIAGGTICFTDEDYPEDDFTLFYAGPCVHIVFHNIYIEAGAAYAKDFSAKYEEDKTQIIPLLQIGYLKYF